MKVLGSGFVSKFGVVGLAVVGLALTACGEKHEPEHPTTTGGGDAPAEGKPAPEVVGEYVTGDGAKSLAETKGTVTIVDFWGTYCEPCKKSFPKLQELVDTQAGKLAIIAVSQDDPEEKKPEDLKKFAEETKVSFPILWDKERKSAGLYHPPTMPTSYVIDKKGNIRFVHAGYKDGEDEKLAKEIEQLIAE